jgi:hypothetical protein
LNVHVEEGVALVRSVDVIPPFTHIFADMGGVAALSAERSRITIEAAAHIESRLIDGHFYPTVDHPARNAEIIRRVSPFG